MNARNYWIAASVSFFVSMMFSLCSYVFGAAVLGGAFVIGLLTTVVLGWVLWAIGLMNYLRGR